MGHAVPLWLWGIGWHGAFSVSPKTRTGPLGSGADGLIEDLLSIDSMDNGPTVGGSSRLACVQVVPRPRAVVAGR